MGLFVIGLDRMGCEARNPFYFLGSEQSALSLPGVSRRRTEETRVKVSKGKKVESTMTAPTGV